MQADASQIPPLMDVAKSEQAGLLEAPQNPKNSENPKSPGKPKSVKVPPLSLRLGLTALAAMAAESATFPLDITKTRMQLQRCASSGVRATSLGTFSAIVREEGVRGLYRGLPPALLRHVAYTSIRITTYEQLRSYVSGGSVGASDAGQSISVAVKALLGGTAGIVGQVVASPADLVKVRMQADGRLVKLGQTPRYRNVADAFSKIVRQEGVAGLYRGVGPNAQRAFLVNMGELSCYDQAKHFIISSGFAEDNIYAHSMASMVSGLVATTLSCPADVVKTRMMNQMRTEGAAASPSNGAPLVYRSSWDCVKSIVKREGALTLWRGFLPTWARLGPWQFVFWVSYEHVRKLCGLASF